MSAPKPEHLQAYLDDIATTAGGIGAEYRWAYPDAYRRSQRTPRDQGASRGPSSRQCGMCQGAGRVCGRCHGRLSGDGICPACPPEAPRIQCPDCEGDGAFLASADRVGNEVQATARYRSKLEWAARNVVDARNRLLTAQVALHEAAALLEPGPASVDRHERALPHPADRGDLARAQAAKDRRESRARGEPVDRGTARAWVDDDEGGRKPIEEPLRPGGAAPDWGEVTG